MHRSPLDSTRAINFIDTANVYALGELCRNSSASASRSRADATTCVLATQVRDAWAERGQRCGLSMPRLPTFRLRAWRSEATCRSGPRSTSSALWDVPVDVNGRRGQWIFDTGANWSTLSAGEAERLGLEIRESDSVCHGGSTGKKNALRLAVASDLRLGRAHLKHVIFLVLIGRFALRRSAEVPDPWHSRVAGDQSARAGWHRGERRPSNRARPRRREGRRTCSSTV